MEEVDVPLYPLQREQLVLDAIVPTHTALLDAQSLQSQEPKEVEAIVELHHHHTPSRIGNEGGRVLLAIAPVQPTPVDVEKDWQQWPLVAWEVGRIHVEIQTVLLGRAWMREEGEGTHSMKD